MLLRQFGPRFLHLDTILCGNEGCHEETTTAIPMQSGPSSGVLDEIGTVGLQDKAHNIITCRCNSMMNSRFLVSLRFQYSILDVICTFHIIRLNNGYDFLAILFLTGSSSQCLRQCEVGDVSREGSRSDSKDSLSRGRDDQCMCCQSLNILLLVTCYC